MAFIRRKTRELAIVFDEYTIRFIEVTMKNNDIFHIHHLSAIENTILEEGVLNKEKWNELLKGYLKSNKIKAKIVKVIIPGSLVIIRHQTVPDLPMKELKQIIQHEFGHSIHLPFNQPVFDLVKIESDSPVVNDEGEPAIQVALVAAPGSFIYPLVEILRENKMKPLIIDIPALSLYNIFTYRYPLLRDQVILLAYITKHGVDLHILDHGILSFTRHIPTEITTFIRVEENEVLDAQKLLEKIQEKENYQSFTSDFAYEIERAVNFYQYTLNHRDKKLNGCWIASEIEFPEGFYHFLQERIDVTVQPLTYEGKDKSEEESNPYKGYEVGLGIFLRKAGMKHGN